MSSRSCGEPQASRANTLAGPTRVEGGPVDAATSAPPATSACASRRPAATSSLCVAGPPAAAIAADPAGEEVVAGVMTAGGGGGGGGGVGRGTMPAYISRPTAGCSWMLLRRVQGADCWVRVASLLDCSSWMVGFVVPRRTFATARPVVRQTAAVAVAAVGAGSGSGTEQRNPVDVLYSM